jgi:DNA-binding IclR family transcriptional regulator
VRRGYLRRCERTHRFKLGFKQFSLADTALTRAELRDRAAPHLQALEQETGLPVHMAIFEQNEAVIIDKVESPELVKHSTWIGKRIDVHCTGVGKGLLAYLSDDEFDHLIQEHGLSKHNENTVTSPRKLKSQLAQIKHLHFALEDQEDELGIRCVGSQVINHLGIEVATVSVSGTTNQITPEKCGFLAQKAVRTSSAISADLL